MKYDRICDPKPLRSIYLEMSSQPQEDRRNTKLWEKYCCSTYGLLSTGQFSFWLSLVRSGLYLEFLELCRVRLCLGQFCSKANQKWSGGSSNIRGTLSCEVAYAITLLSLNLLSSKFLLAAIVHLVSSSAHQLRSLVSPHLHFPLLNWMNSYSTCSD